MYQQFLIVLFWIYDRIFNVSYLEELNAWKLRDRLSVSELECLEESRLIQLQIALMDNPYYMDKSPFDSNWFLEYPLLNKTILNENSIKMISFGTNIKKLIVESSSGSSGMRSKVFMSRRESFNVIAAQTHLWSWAGYKPGDKLIQLGMTPQRSAMKLLKDRLFRVLYLPAFQINNQVVDSNLMAMKRYQAKFFGGYASGLYAYAKRANELGIELHFVAVISWGDKLFSHYRREIERAFSCKVFDTYGSTEGLVIAGQCEYMNYHILTPHVKLELLSGLGFEVEPGELGRVTVTRLDGLTQPLVRYQLGDLAIKKATQEICECGRPYPMLEQIVGRNTDVVQTPAGNKLIVHFFTGIFEHIHEIEQFKVLQTSVYDVTIEVIHRLDEAHWKEVANRVQGIIWDKAGEQFNFSWKQVLHIANSPSGKPQIIQSTIPL
jgi:phenylacetate-CoA ligase